MQLTVASLEESVTVTAGARQGSKARPPAPTPCCPPGSSGCASQPTWPRRSRTSPACHRSPRARPACRPSAASPGPHPHPDRRRPRERRAPGGSQRDLPRSGDARERRGLAWPGDRGLRVRCVRRGHQRPHAERRAWLGFRRALHRRPGSRRARPPRVPRDAPRLRERRNPRPGPLARERRLREPGGRGVNSGYRDYGFRARADRYTASGALSLAWQSDLGRDVGRPRNNSQRGPPLLPERGLAPAHRLLGGHGAPRLQPARGQRVLRDPRGRDRPGPLRHRQLGPEPRAGGREREGLPRAGLRPAPIGGARLELGVDVNGRFGLEALEVAPAFGSDGALVRDDEIVSVEDARRTDPGLLPDGRGPARSRLGAVGRRAGRPGHDPQRGRLLRRPLDLERRRLGLRRRSRRARSGL